MKIILDSKQQALTFRDDMAEKLDDLLSTALDGSFIALTHVRTAMVNDINSRIAKLPSVLIYVPDGTLPALVVAHNIYYDASREDEIIARNNPPHPGFMTGGRDVEYLN